MAAWAYSRRVPVKKPCIAPYGIRVHCVAPGATRVRPCKVPKDFRPGTSRENGELIAFWVSDRCPYITGAVIRVDGGLVLPGIAEGFAPTTWIDPEWIARHRVKWTR